MGKGCVPPQKCDFFSLKMVHYNANCNCHIIRQCRDGTGSAILAESAWVTGQCVVSDPEFDLVLSFNMLVYHGVVPTE